MEYRAVAVSQYGTITVSDPLPGPDLAAMKSQALEWHFLSGSVPHTIYIVSQEEGTKKRVIEWHLKTHETLNVEKLEWQTT